MTKPSEMKSAIVQSFKEDILRLEVTYDAIVRDLKNKPMQKAEYDAIENELRDLVFAMKDEVETL